MRAFLRVHRALPLVVAIALVALLAPILRSAALALDLPLALQPQTLALPILVASLIGEAVSTPMAEIEETAVRQQRLAVLLYGLGMLLLAAVALGTAPARGFVTEAWPSAVRNLLGLTGGAFLSSAWLGGRRAFVLPLGIGLAIATPNLTPDSSWIWLLTAERDLLAWAISLGLLMAGSVALTLRAPILR